MRRTTSHRAVLLLAACVCLLATTFVQGFHVLRPVSRPRTTALGATTLPPKQSTTTTNAPPRGMTSSRAQMSEQMRQVREDMEKDEKVKLLMQSLRGQALNDNDNAAEGTNMLVVEMDEGSGDDVLPLTYQPEKLEAYFAKRPGAVRKRLFQLLTISSGFFASLALDAARGKLVDNDVKRAAQLREIITSMGPFSIKLGQALSIRPDILSPRAMVELQKLCDKVPSYDNKLAMATIEKELGKPVDELFSELTTDPVAAASLGQVYKGKLRATGEAVAVKVQRPFVLETVSLDLYLIRNLGLNLRKIPFLKDRTDIVALLDEFASRFYDELDYVTECQNGIMMHEDMKSIEQVVVPLPFPEYCSRKVHVAQWIEGEKLSQSTASDVQDLVNVGVVAYLTQLLETGRFHADPHPGNLIRTPEGKLCILDFGLQCEVTEDQRYGMIEAISHLVHRDYSRIGQDFQTLDFIPKGTDLTPIIPALSKVFDAALAGGGAKSINFQDLSADLAEITFKYPFRIPPYFALIIRAIGVLEGIALVGNPGFAIVDEAYPYISKRLLTDESPRLRAALKYMIYGKEGVFDVDRLIDLLQAFEALEAVNQYETVGVGGGADGPSSPAAALAANTANGNNVRDALRFFFSPEGQFFRDFLLDETVKGVDAVSREGLRQVAQSIGFKGPWVPPVLKAMVPRLNDKDKKVVENVQKLLGFFLGVGSADMLGSEGSPSLIPSFGLVSGLRGGAVGGGNGLLGGGGPFAGAFSGTGRGAQTREQLEMARELAPVLRELAPQMRVYGLQVVGKLTDRVASRFLRFARDQLLGPNRAAETRFSTPNSR